MPLKTRKKKEPELSVAVKYSIGLWNSCYSESWDGLIVPEAFAHPAKMARGLVVRIFDHCFERGYLRRGDTVVDCFGGIGSTLIEAAHRGLHAFAVEIEPRFILLGQQNLALHRRVWELSGDPLPVLVQGDSRRLCELLAPVMANACIGSPPFADSDTKPTALGIGNPTRANGDGAGRNKGDYHYGQSPGQLGAMFEGRVADAVIGSPPFSGTEQPCASQSQAKKDYHAFTRGNGTKRDATMTDGAGAAAGQLSAMKTGSVDAICSSPPYAESIGTPSLGSAVKADWVNREGGDIAARRAGPNAGEYDDTAGQLNALPAGGLADACVGSPPYEEGLGHGGMKPLPLLVEKRLHAALSNNGYGGGEGNISNDRGETFWRASRTILEQCFTILRPGGVAVWVLKSFVRNGAVVDFPGDWQRVCEAVGFEPIEYIRAMLVKHDRAPSLFGGEDVRTTSKKSFFRRLHEKRRPDLAIDNEVVLIVRKPVVAAARSGGGGRRKP